MQKKNSSETIKQEAEDAVKPIENKGLRDRLVKVARMGSTHHHESYFVVNRLLRRK